MRLLPRILSLVCLLACLSPACARPPRVLAEFDIFKDGDVLLLPVQFRGKEYLFALDTGAMNSIYDSTFRAQLGDPVRSAWVETARGSIQMPRFPAPEASVGKMSFRTNEPVLCTDLKACREESGHRIMGVIGLDFLRQHRIRINFDAGKLEFLDAVESAPGIPIPLVYPGQLFYVITSVAGEEEKFMIDTGFWGYTNGALTAKLFERLLTARKIKKVSKGRVLSAADDAEDQIGALGDFGIGPFAHRQLLFHQGQRNILGLCYLCRYIVTFDFPDQMMYLKKGKRFAQPDRHEQSGLSIVRVDGKTVVEFVDTGSPAARTGIQPKDILLKLDDLDAQKTRMQVLRQRLTRKGETVRLRLRRGEQQRELTLKLGK